MSDILKSPLILDTNYYINLIHENKSIIIIITLILCVILVCTAIIGFNYNHKYDGLPNLLISTSAYITTTIALILVLLHY